MKRLLVFILAVAIIFSFNATCFAQMATKSGAEDFTNTGADLNLDVKSAVLMEAVTGEVLYEINKDEALPPASVTKIEEGAFEFTNISKVTIHPNSPAGIVKNKGIYTNDESTLLWALEATKDGEYIVPNGVTRIGRCAVDANRGFTTVVIPSNVEKIYYKDNEDYHYDGLTIKAPAGSYAIRFAKKHGIDYVEIESD